MSMSADFVPVRMSDSASGISKPNSKTTHDGGSLCVFGIRVVAQVVRKMQSNICSR